MTTPLPQPIEGGQYDDSGQKIVPPPAAPAEPEE